MTTTVYIPGSFAATFKRYLETRHLQSPDLTKQLTQKSESTLISGNELTVWFKRIYDLDPVPALGLRIGHLVKAEDFGLLGKLTLTCSNLRQALNRYRHYRILILGRHDVMVSEQQDQFRIDWHLPTPNTPQVLEFCLAAFVSLYQSLIGSPLPPLRVGLPMAEPKDAILYEALMGCPVEFSCRNSYVIIPSKLMARRIKTANRQQQQQLEIMAQQLMKKKIFPQEKLFAKAWQYIETKLSTPPILAHDVARQLRMSDYRFQLLLQQNNMTFRQLIAQIRLASAQSLLTHTDDSLSDIAKRLGFSEQSSFIRAFKKWTGATPGEFRNQNQDDHFE